MRKEKHGIAHFKIYFFLKTLKLYVYFHVQLYSFHLLNCLKFRLTLLQYKSQNTLINIHIISYYKSLLQISSMYITSESLENNTTLKTSKKKQLCYYKYITSSNGNLNILSSPKTVQRDLLSKCSAQIPIQVQIRSHLIFNILIIKDFYNIY